MAELLSRYIFGGIKVIFLKEKEIVSMVLDTSGNGHEIDTVSLKGLDPINQVSVSGDKLYRHYCGGQTLRNSETCFSLKFFGQEESESGDVKTVKTQFKNNRFTYNNYIEYKHDSGAVEIYNELINNGKESACVEMLPSFSISNIFPYNTRIENLYLHRIMARWSMEGMVDSSCIAKLCMEES